MKRTQRIVFLAALLLVVSGYTECYKPVGRGDGLPKHIKTLAIPPFQNPSLRFKVEQRFTAAMVDEALRRARLFEVVSTTEGADAVMLGTIKNFAFRPVLLDDLGRARLFEVIITAGVTVRDQTRNKILFDNQNYVFRGECEITGDRPAGARFREERVDDDPGRVLMKRTGSANALKSQSEFHRRLKEGKVSPLYLLEGQERYLRNQAVKQLLNVAVDASVRDFNFAAISVSQGDLGEALALARQYPMISARRMILSRASKRSATTNSSNC